MLYVIRDEKGQYMFDPQWRKAGSRGEVSWVRSGNIWTTPSPSEAKVVVEQLAKAGVSAEVVNVEILN
jgi:hypothetical protein